ncbi:MAG: metalloregulator ArsR/SmtB family transcription factor [Flavobacteriales bacterium]
MRRDVFQAIADPTRREIIGLIATQPQNVNSVAEQFSISRPAVSKHMKILEECGLVMIQTKGRERYCTARLDKLNEVHDWIEKYRKIWMSRFDSLENYLQELQSKTNNKLQPMGTNPKDLSEKEEREVTFERLNNAPRDLVFEVWSDPHHLAQWFGPNGFTITTHNMDFREGGRWRFMMHGPDGKDYPNKVVYTEIKRPERIVYHHADDEEVQTISFHVTITFEDRGGKTMVRNHMIFEKREVLEFVAIENKAIEGGHQNMNRMEAYVIQRLSEVSV